MSVVSSEHLAEYQARRLNYSLMVISGSQTKRREEVCKLFGIQCALFIQGGQYSTHEMFLLQHENIPIVAHVGSGSAAGGQCPYKELDAFPITSTSDAILLSTDPEVVLVVPIAKALASACTTHLQKDKSGGWRMK